jgi:hypothetical protein
LQDKIG